MWDSEEGWDSAAAPSPRPFRTIARVVNRRRAGRDESGKERIEDSCGIGVSLIERLWPWGLSLAGTELAVRGTTIDEQAAVLSGEKAGDPQFLHAVLCQLGLPRNSTTSRTFERTSGRASLRLQAGSVYDG